MGKAPGKKVGHLFIEVDGIRVKFELRLEVSSGRFHVEHQGKVYTGSTKAELAAQMEDVARVSQAITWSRYIVLDYESRRPGEDSWQSTTRRDLGDRAPDYVTGIQIDWMIKELSSPHIPIGETEQVILERKPGSTEVEGVHRPSGRGRHRQLPALPEWAIPYTEERMAVLMQLRAALTAVDRKLRGFFGKNVEAATHALDQGFEATGLPPLALPPPEPHAPKCDSLDRSCNCGATVGEDDAGNEIEIAPNEQEHERWCRVKRVPRCSCGKGDDDDED